MPGALRFALLLGGLAALPGVCADSAIVPLTVCEIVRDLVLRRKPFVDVSPLAAERFAVDAPRPEHNVI